MGLQETDVSVYNTVPRTSYGCYRRAEVLLETHVRITRSVYCLSPAVRSLLVVVWQYILVVVTFAALSFSKTLYLHWKILNSDDKVATINIYSQAIVLPLLLV